MVFGPKTALKVCNTRISRDYNAHTIWTDDLRPQNGVERMQHSYFTWVTALTRFGQWMIPDLIISDLKTALNVCNARIPDGVTLKPAFIILADHTHEVSPDSSSPFQTKGSAWLNLLFNGTRYSRNARDQKPTTWDDIGA